jgi:hypothetical protein
MANPTVHRFMAHPFAPERLLDLVTATAFLTVRDVKPTQWPVKHRPRVFPKKRKGIALLRNLVPLISK